MVVPYSITPLCHYSSLVDRVFVEEIYGHPIFIWFTVTRQGFENCFYFSHTVPNLLIWVGSKTPTLRQFLWNMDLYRHSILAVRHPKQLSKQNPIHLGDVLACGFQQGFSTPVAINGTSMVVPYSLAPSGHYNSLVDRVFVDEIYGHPIFIWITGTWQGWQGTRIVITTLDARCHALLCLLRSEDE